MGVLFDFSRLIEKYGIECSLCCGASGGSYEGGNWLPDKIADPVDITGALIPMTDRKRYQSGGVYTESDREFISQTKIPLEADAYILYEGARYHVEDNTDFFDYAGFYSYNLKRVGAFDRTAKN